MGELRLLHPLVLLGAKLALVFALAPAIEAAARLVLGRKRDDAFAAESPGGRGLAVGLGAALAGMGLGLSALDPRLLPVAVATHIVAQIAAMGLGATLASGPSMRLWRAHAQEPIAAAQRAPMIVTLVIGLVPLGLIVAAVVASKPALDPVAPESLARAPLRAALLPTSADARLGLAYLATHHDELPRARRELALARALGGKERVALEIESELAARGGDCRRAIDLFHRSLEPEAPSFDRDGHLTPLPPLRLGGFHIPASLITRCDFASGTARSSERREESP